MALLATSFRWRVLAAVCRIGPGRVATYGDIARAAGRPRAWRAVGSILRTCDRPDVPCHRVIAAGGMLGGYGSNPQLKAALLRSEGLQVVGRRVRNWQERRSGGGTRQHPGAGRRPRKRT